MGRSKSVPVRRHHTNGSSTCADGNGLGTSNANTTTTTLGRRTLAPTKQGQQEYIQAAWIQEQLVMSQHDDSTMTSGGGGKNKNAAVASRENNKDDDDSVFGEWEEIHLSSSNNEATKAASNTSTAASSPPPLEASKRRKRRIFDDDSSSSSVDDNEQDERAQPHPGKGTTQRTKGTARKTVSFYNPQPRRKSIKKNGRKHVTHQSPAAETPPSQPSNLVWQWDNNARPSSDATSIVLRYRAELDKGWTDKVYIVYSPRIPQIQVVQCVHETIHTPTIPTEDLVTLTCPTLLQDLLRRFFPSLEEHTLDSLVQHRLVVLQLDRQLNRCFVALTGTALTCCQPTTLPLVRQKHARKYAPARAVHALLTTCWSTVTVWPGGGSRSSSSSSTATTTAAVPPLTARRVYACTDNRQYNNDRLATAATVTQHIPRLKPTLREYQKAAVAWMVQREQASHVTADEWRLAWYVLRYDANHPQRVVLSPLSANDKDDDDATDTILYICPSAGWMTTSLHTARTMMMPDDTVTGVRGGILAEEMGLGKTVELLACILAHPRPGAASSSSLSTRRKLNWDEPAGSVEDLAMTKTMSMASKPYDEVAAVSQKSVDDHACLSNRVGLVGDISEFGDDESIGSSDEIPVSTRSSVTATIPATPSRSFHVPVPVTPDQEPHDEEPVDVRWLEDDDSPIGSCICGTLIHWTDLAKPVIFCPTCNEPMHQQCAAFASYNEMTKHSTLIEYRRMFSDDKYTCRLANNDDICPCCLSDKKKKFESRATLIVTPPAISGQWQREIKKHINCESFSVAVYEGIERTCKSYGPRKEDTASIMRGVHPCRLADHDIVVVTFDVLMADLGHSDNNKFVAGDSRSNLRKRKRYRIVPSPLTMINWWRVCLDEAQRVERPTAQSAQMALKLEAEYRWCVTGTPIGKGKLEDLFGLLLFLRMDPFSYRPFFDTCFSPVHPDIDDRIRGLLQDVFWRSTKKNPLVCEQMGIPEQIEKKVLLQFSSVERHFYDRQLEQTLQMAGDVADRAKRGKKRTTKQLNLLADRLHSLRAACCHPQVGASGIGKARKSHGRKKDADGGNISVASRVMTMDEILVSFIDDARLKCEEAQRLVVLHTNAIAAISRLKVEAKARNISIQQSDEALLISSCKNYMESLELGEKNALPTLILGRAIMTGSTGFMHPHAHIEGGQGCIQWKLSTIPTSDIWCKIDFEGHSRRLTHIKLRHLSRLPTHVAGETSKDVQWCILRPKKCVLQVSNIAVGGEFVDVTEITFSEREEDGEESPWVSSQGFRTNKSKSWRIVVRDYYGSPCPDENSRFFLGLDVQLHEPDIAFDPLQRLHCLHNASLSFTSLLQVRENNLEERPDGARPLSSFFLTTREMEDRISSMKKDACTIESLYMDVARSLHKECIRRLEESVRSREEEEEKLSLYHKKRLTDCFEDGWWDDFLAFAHLYGSENHKQQLYDRVVEDLDMLQGGPERGLIRFPPFRDLHGLRVALQSRMREIRRGIGKPTSWLGTVDTETSAPIFQFREDRFKYAPGGFANCMKTLCSLSSHPTDHELYTNSHCRVCKADWNQTGPKCHHCEIGDTINELEPDRLTLLLLNSIHNVLKSTVGHALLSQMSNSRDLETRAAKFFDIMEAHKREKINAWRFWRCHLDLLNDLDELNQCKASMRLVAEGEDLSSLTDDQLNAVVIPSDLNARYHDHVARQAMADGDLRRAKATLRFLRNQSLERHQAASGQEDDHCMVCLAPFEEGNRAVLRCGHSFHKTPCLERLTAQGSTEVRCPCRCRTRTKLDEVMIASEQRRDDGSRSQRSIKGSWGTKVTRLVGDCLDIRDKGEKGLVFSQWEDMLDIVEEALHVNGVKFVRARSLAKISKAIDTFRLPDYCVMLLNVKNGAEGLTLLEATHVFMVEPLLNHGLDMQAVNRIHRIGQTNKTHVHRYIMQGSVEMKIEARRLEHQDDSVEDALMEAKSTPLRAGGIDGGFKSESDLLEILTVEPLESIESESAGGIPADA